MNQTREFTVEQSARLDVFLAEQMPELSRSKIQVLIRDGHTTVDDELILDPSYMLKAEQTVRFVEPDPEPEFPEAEAGEVNVIYEDDAVMVIDKPAGVITHPNTYQDRGTLVQQLLFFRPEIKAALYDPESRVSRMRPGIVHRLDKDTSGLMVVAKTREAMQELSKQFHEREVHKEYETLLYGALREPKTVTAPILRKGGGTSAIMVASHDPGQGRSAITYFIPLETYAPYEKWPEELATRCRVKIETGRTHQIRVHAKFIGHPVLGDHIYSNKPSQKLSEKIGLTTQVLRAVSLEFTHPTSGEVKKFELS